MWVCFSRIVLNLGASRHSRGMANIKLVVIPKVDPGTLGEGWDDLREAAEKLQEMEIEAVQASYPEAQVEVWDSIRTPVVQDSEGYDREDIGFLEVKALLENAFQRLCEESV